MDQDIKPADTEEITESNLGSTNVVDSAVPPPDAKKPKSKKKLFIIPLVLLTTIVFVGAWFMTRTDNKQTEESLKITIGDITITQTDIDRYAKSVENYKKANPEIVLEGEAKDIATDDLVMNAALIKEAKERNKQLTEEEKRIAFNLSKGVKIEDFKKSIDQYKASDNQKYYEAITIENRAMRRKLKNELIADQTVFYINSSFDSPFFRNETDHEKIAQIHEQVKTRLQNEFLPLFESDATKEDIAKKADINNLQTADVKPNSTEANKKNESDLELYSTKAVVSADVLENYSATPDNARYLDYELIAKTNGAEQSRSFKDLDGVDYGTPIDDLRDTATEISKIKKVGEHTEVFASKTGVYMIARIEKSGGGDYVNWQSFLDSYKDKYINNKTKTSFANQISKVATTAANKAVPILTSIGEETAVARHNSQGCGAHELNMSAAMIDSNWNIIGGGTIWLEQAAGSACPGMARKTQSDGYVSGTGNCWNGNAPNFGGQAPSGWQIYDRVPGNYTVQGANNTGSYNAYIYVRQNQTTVHANSTLLKDTGPQFGPDARISGHALGLGWSIYSRDTSYISTSWTVGSGTQNTINATAPSTVTERNGTVWRLADGVPSQKTRNNITNNETATFNFTYTRSDEPPTCTGTDGQQYPIGDSRCDPTSSTCTGTDGQQYPIGDSRCAASDPPFCSLTATPSSIQSGEDVVLSWATYGDATSLNVGPDTNAGPFLTVGTPVGGGSTTLTNITSDVRFTGVVTGPGGSRDCRTQIIVQPSSTESTDSPYLRIFGNDVITGSRFLDASGSCSAVSNDTTIRAVADKNASNQWYGASSEFAVFDYGNVDQFFSNSLSTVSSASPPLDLTFGNYNNGSRVSNYGGNSGLAPCLPDYYGDAISNGATARSPADANIPTTPIANGERKLIVVDGDIRITDNITYQNTTWNSVEEIPNFYLIVRGNITIAPTVTQLDGIYVAQPIADGSKGQIYTCANELKNRYRGSDLKTICLNKLTINGSFIAKKSFFDRTNGKLNPATIASSEPADSPNIAEVFNFSPEAYLTPLNSSLETTLPYEKYDYIVSLPPVL